MTFKRWLPTFLAFPIGGYVAMQTIGSLHDVASAAAGGLIAGAAIGAAQALALRTGGRWAAATAAAMAAGAALAATVTGAGTEVADVVLAGGIAGAAVGAAQGALLRRGAAAAAAWTAVTSASWALAWFTTANVIVDLDRGHHVFGSSGALVATVLTGLALRRILAARFQACSPECPGWDSNPQCPRGSAPLRAPAVPVRLPGRVRRSLTGRQAEVAMLDAFAGPKH